MTPSRMTSALMSLCFAATSRASLPVEDSERLSMEILFLASSPSRVLHVQLDDTLHEGERALHAEWAQLGDEGVEVHERHEVRPSSSSPLFRDLPASLQGVVLTGHEDGTLLLTLDDINPWTARPTPTREPFRSAVALASPRALRLLVEPARETTSLSSNADDHSPVWRRASAHRQGLAVESDALVTVGPVTSGGRWLHLVRAGVPRTIALDGAPGVFIPDSIEACGRVVPGSVLLLEQPAGPARLLRTGDPACLPSGRVLLRFDGEALGEKGREPVTAVLVELAASPREAQQQEARPSPRHEPRGADAGDREEPESSPLPFEREVHSGAAAAKTSGA